jgi:predicted neuraminidase
MIRQEFIYQTAPLPSCHASTLAVTKEGDVVAAWFGGRQEGAPDVGIWFARRGVDAWTAPVKVASGMGVPCWNPVLHQTAAGALLLFYKVGPSPMTWSGAVLSSLDGGRNWSAPELLPAGVLGPIKNKPVELRDGTLVCGSSVESHQLWGCWVERTPDHGRTWTKHGPINVPGHYHGAIQPAVFGQGQELAMVCRTRGLHRLVRAASRDGGRSWSPLAPVDLPQNNSGVDAVRLRDGRVLLIYNHATDARTPLNLAVSKDMGRTWTAGAVLESAPGEYSYPAIIQAPDGRIHFTYTWRRERIRYGTVEPGDL